MKIKKIHYGTKLPVVLTLKERDTIRDMTVGDPNFGNIGIMEGKNIKLMMSLDDIEDIQGYVTNTTLPAWWGRERSCSSKRASRSRRWNGHLNTK